MTELHVDEQLLPRQVRKRQLEAKGHRRIIWDDEGFIVEGKDVAQEIARQSSEYSEEVELVNMPGDLREKLKVNRVSLEQITASEYATRIYEALSGESSIGVDAPSLFIAAVGVKGTIDPPKWDDERLIQKLTQHVVNLVGLCTKTLGLDPNGIFETLPKVPPGMRIERTSLGSVSTPDSPFGHAEFYMDIIEEHLKAVRSARAKYIVLDCVMSAMASRMGLGDAFTAELNRFIGEVSKPSPSGLVGVFGLE